MAIWVGLNVFQKVVILIVAKENSRFGPSEPWESEQSIQSVWKKVQWKYTNQSIGDIMW